MGRRLNRALEFLVSDYFANGNKPETCFILLVLAVKERERDRIDGG